MINYELTKIRGLAFDVDGVLSTNIVHLTNDTQPLRTANIKDGYAIQHAVKMGLQLAIITGGCSESVRHRYEALGVQHIFLGAGIKMATYEKWMTDCGLKRDEISYMGDDIPDYEVMSHCGLPCCPADAAIEIRKISTYISPVPGGYGCVRDVIEQVMRAQGKWMSNATAFGW